MLFLLLENLKTINFALRVDDPLIGHLHYWDLMARSSVPLPAPLKKSNTPTTPPPHAKVQLSPSPSSNSVNSPSTTSTDATLPIASSPTPTSSISIASPAETPQNDSPINSSLDERPSTQESQSLKQDPSWSAALAPSSNSNPLVIQSRLDSHGLPLDLRPDTPSEPASLPIHSDISPRVESISTSLPSKSYDFIDNSFHHSPFPSDYEDTEVLAEKPTRHTTFQHVLVTPPGSGRLPSTPPSTQSSLSTGFSGRAPTADVLLGTTPSQADLPHLLASISTHAGLSENHSKLIHNVQKSVQSLKSSLELRDTVTTSTPMAIEFLNSVEAVLLDNFSQTLSIDHRYSCLWEWLANVSPATPHVTHILAPLAHISQLSHLSHAVRCRAFINASLNRKCFDSILSNLVLESDNSAGNLNPDRLLATEALRNVFFRLIQDLKQYQFDLPEDPTDASILARAPEPALEAIEQLPTLVSQHQPPAPQPAPQPSNEDANEKPASFKRKKKVVTISDAPATPSKPRVDRKEPEPPSSPSPPHNPISPFNTATTSDLPHALSSDSLPSLVPSPPPLEPKEVEPVLNLPSWSIMSTSDPADSSDASDADIGSDMGGWRVVASYTRTAPDAIDLPTPEPIAHLGSPPPLSQTDPVYAASASWSSDDDSPIDTETLPSYQPEPGQGARRNRSFSGNAPTWAKEIQQFPQMGSYRPNTDWLSGADELSEPESFTPPTRTTMGTSSRPISPATSPTISLLPGRFLNASIISDYVPSAKSSTASREEISSIASSSSSSSSDVVKIRALEGEAALAEDTMLYKNSKPADFFILELVSKPALTAKNSLCSACGDDLTPSTARWCAYSSNFYCPKCHSNKKAILPARVIKQWNFKPAKVSNYAYDYLQSNWNRPVLDVTNLDQESISRSSRETALGLPIPIKLPLISRNRNSSVSIINHLTTLRERLVSVAEFIRACRNGPRLLSSLAERLHLLWSSTLWSMQDLVDAKTGKLEPLLKKYTSAFASHVRSCDSCSGKGFVCEICTAKEVIYPFEADTASCPKCKALFHESCWKSHPGKCPKCVRVRAIRGKEN